MDGRKLTDILRQELRLQTQYAKLLEQQKRALLACDRRTFAILQPEQDLLVAAMAQQDDLRKLAMTDAAGNIIPVAQLQASLPSGPQKTVDALKRELKRVLAHVESLSRENERLIQNELHYISFAMDLYIDAGRKAESYGGTRSSRRLFLDRQA